MGWGPHRGQAISEKWNELKKKKISKEFLRRWKACLSVMGRLQMFEETWEGKEIQA